MAGEIHKGVIEVVVDGSGVTAGVEQAKASLKQLEGAAASAGSKLGAGVGSGASQAGKSTEQLDAVTRRFLTTLERESMQAGRTRSEYLALRAAKLGVSDSTGAMIARIRDAERGVERMGLTAKQTTAALRQVPSQFTDIIVSLQGGQSPMQVLLQQGGQLKDVFGGIQPAVRALGGYVAGLINPFTLAAGAVAGLGYAYFLGSKEADAYARATILTGNVTGTTVGQLSDMARAIGAVTGSQSAAAEALAQFASSGQVAANRLEEFTTVALKMERLTGTAVSETVKKFVELGKAPVEAARKLNEAENFLTTAIYEQIKALDEQGKATEAAALAQSTYADTAASRLDQLQDRLGYIERGWNAVRDATIGAANAALNIGRTPSNNDRIEQLRDGAAKARAPLNFGLFESRAKAMELEADSLERTEAAARRAAAADRDRAVIAKEGIAGVERATKITQQYATEQEKVNRALAEYRRENEKIRAANPDSKLLDPALVARTEKGIRDQFAKKGGGARSSPVEIDTGKSELEAQLADSKRILDSLTGAYRNAESILEAVRSAGLVSEADYYEQKRKFITDNAKAQRDAAIDQEAALELEAERLQAKAADLRANKKTNDAVRVDREIIDLNRKIADSEEKRAQATANATTQVELLNIRQKASQDALTRSYVESQKAAELYLRTFQNRQDRAVEAVGQGDKSRGFNSGINDIEDRFAERRAQLERERRTGLFKDNEAGYLRELALLQQTKDAELAIYRNGFKAVEAAQADFANGAKRAFENYLDGIKDVASATDSLFTKAFSGLEDALLDFTKTGRLSLKSLAQGISDDINRTIIRQNITGPLAEWLQRGLKTGEGAAGSIMGGLDVLMGGSKSKGTDTAQQGFVALRTLGIDPATDALMRFTQAANGAQFGGSKPAEFSLDGAFTGEGAVKSLFDAPADGAEAFASTLVDTRTGTQQFLDILKPASQALSGMGQAGQTAAFALQLLPQIIQAMQSSSGGSGSGGGFLGSILGMFGGGAPSGAIGGGGGFGSGADFGNMDLGGFLASGGTANAGTAYMVGEQGRELFIPRTSGTVVPNGQTEKIMRGGGQTLTQNFYVTGAVDKRTQGQVFSQAAMGATTARARGTAAA